MSNHDDKEFRAQMGRIESLVGKIESFTDPAAREQTRALLSALLELHGRGIDCMLEHIAAAGDVGMTLIESMAKDELVSNLLLLHGLHPADFPTRIAAALDKVRPLLRSHGGNVELLSVADGVVRLRLQGSCHGCPSSAATLKGAIEEAIYEMAPDVAAIEVEGVTTPSTSLNEFPVAGFVPVDALFNKHPATAAV